MHSCLAYNSFQNYALLHTFKLIVNLLICFIGCGSYSIILFHSDFVELLEILFLMLSTKLFSAVKTIWRSICRPSYSIRFVYIVWMWTILCSQLLFLESKRCYLPCWEWSMLVLFPCNICSFTDQATSKMIDILACKLTDGCSLKSCVSHTFSGII